MSLRKLRVRVGIVTVSVLLLGVVPTFAATVISVKIGKKGEVSIDPANPTVNRRGLEAVGIQIEGNLKKGWEYRSRIDSVVSEWMPIDSSAKSLNRVTGAAADVSGPYLSLHFRRCGSKNLKKWGLAATPWPRHAECPVVRVNGSKTGWDVLIDEGSFWITVYEEPGAGAANSNAPPKEVAHVPVHVVARPFALGWSGGFAFLRVQDERYRLGASSEGDSTNDGSSMDGSDSTTDGGSMKIVRVSDAGRPYHAAAFANYTLIKHAALGFSFGFSSDVPVENLTTMAGVSVALPTFTKKTAGRVTAGYAYTTHDVLKAKYEGLGVAPQGTTADDLVEKRSTGAFFVAITFEFWGSEDKFKGVYSGNADKQSGSEK